MMEKHICLTRWSLFALGIVLLIVLGYITQMFTGSVRANNGSLDEIDETIREGEAYGFRIGATKEETFSQIALLASTQQARQLLTYIYQTDKNYPRQLEEVAEEFSDWRCWEIEGFLDSEFQSISLHFDSSDSTLQSIMGDPHNETILFNSELPFWPIEDEGNLHISGGMSYDEVYAILLKLRAIDKYKNITVQSHLFRVVTEFGDRELARMKRQNVWYVLLNPVPKVLGGENYIRLQFEEEHLIEIRRVQHERSAD